MSLVVAPEAVAVVAPPVVARPVAPRPDTRPIEPTDQANARSAEQKQSSTKRNPSNGAPDSKPTPSARPPGVDPSLPPQALFDASLISEDFKPSIRTEDIVRPQVGDDGASAEPVSANDQPPSDAGDAAGNPDPASSAPAAHNAESAVGVRQIAAYDRVQNGSPLSLPPAANPDWLTAIERIA